MATSWHKVPSQAIAWTDNIYCCASAWLVNLPNHHCVPIAHTVWANVVRRRKEIGEVAKSYHILSNEQKQKRTDGHDMCNAVTVNWQECGYQLPENINMSTNTVVEIKSGDKRFTDILSEFKILRKSDKSFVYPDEISNSKKYSEGAKKQITVNAYERNPQARQACIEYYGCKCQACGLIFEDIYGKIGKDFIHVHHIIPLSDINEEYEIDPKTDLIPLCPNCHAMIHKLDNMDLDKLKSVMDSNFLNFINTVKN